MLRYIYCVTVLYLLNAYEALRNLNGWNYINLYCRDNLNRPVDWWYIYKPPNEDVPYMSRGDNFSYISTDTIGHWHTSDKHLTANSMLHYTLSPIFRPTYVDYLGIVKYDDRKGVGAHDPGTSAHGLLMADEMGGVWISHTVPNFPDLAEDRLTFPHSESPNGHLFVCLSLDLETLNTIGAMLKQISPNFVDIKLPKKIKPLLPDWNYLKHPMYQIPRGFKLPTDLDFYTKGKTLRAKLLIRKPGERHCLYERFAKEKQIVLDVYGREHGKPTCQKNFGLRTIDAISLKIQEEVYYISNKTDHAVFAVSTAAHWQRIGSGTAQFWACVNSQDSTGKGAVMLCVEDYNVWLSFDNLKVKEPNC